MCWPVKLHRWLPGQVLYVIMSLVLKISAILSTCSLLVNQDFFLVYHCMVGATTECRASFLEVLHLLLWLCGL